MKKVIIFLSLLIAANLETRSQIPNNGFENWTSMGAYSDPDNWDQLNSMTNFASVYTCTKGTPGNPGTGYLKLVSKNVSGMGVVPGIAATGSINVGSMQVDGGFSFTQRPQSLTGAWQYMASGADQGYVSVLLTRWNTGMNMRDTIAVITNPLTGMVMTWTNFTLNFTYLSGANPDTARIILSASGMTPVANSYLYVDDLAFAGSVAGINELNSHVVVNLFPNPVVDKLNIRVLNSSPQSVGIYDIQGKIIKSIDFIKHSREMVIDVSELSKGLYTLKITTQSGVASRKFLK